MNKPWYKSISVVGGITWAVGKLADPAVLDLLHTLPLTEHQRATASTIVQAAGAIAAIFGIRRNMPDATLFRTDSGAIAVHDPSGALTDHLEAPRNEHGETAGEELHRLETMGRAGAELRRTLEAREGGRRPGGG